MRVSKASTRGDTDTPVCLPAAVHYQPLGWVLVLLVPVWYLSCEVTGKREVPGLGVGFVGHQWDVR